MCIYIPWKIKKNVFSPFFSFLFLWRPALVVFILPWNGVIKDYISIPKTPGHLPATALQQQYHNKQTNNKFLLITTTNKMMITNSRSKLNVILLSEFFIQRAKKPTITHQILNNYAQQLHRQIILKTSTSQNCLAATSMYFTVIPATNFW